MTAQEIKDLFVSYAALVYEVDSLRTEHKNIEMRYARSPFAAADKKEQLRRCERLCQKIIAREKELIITRDRLETMMTYIKIPFGRAIIRKRYFLRESWQKLSFGVNYSMRQCITIQSKAFAEISEKINTMPNREKQLSSAKKARAKHFKISDFS